MSKFDSHQDSSSDSRNRGHPKQSPPPLSALTHRNPYPEAQGILANKLIHAEIVQRTFAFLDQPTSSNPCSPDWNDIQRVLDQLVAAGQTGVALQRADQIDTWLCRAIELHPDRGQQHLLVNTQVCLLRWQGAYFGRTGAERSALKSLRRAVELVQSYPTGVPAELSGTVMGELGLILLNCESMHARELAGSLISRSRLCLEQVAETATGQALRSIVTAQRALLTMSNRIAALCLNKGDQTAAFCEFGRCIRYAERYFGEASDEAITQRENFAVELMASGDVDNAIRYLERNSAVLARQRTPDESQILRTELLLCRAKLFSQSLEDIKRAAEVALMYSSRRLALSERGDLRAPPAGYSVAIIEHWIALHQLAGECSARLSNWEHAIVHRQHEIGLRRFTNPQPGDKVAISQLIRAHQALACAYLETDTELTRPVNSPDRESLGNAVRVLDEARLYAQRFDLTHPDLLNATLSYEIQVYRCCGALELAVPVGEELIARIVMQHGFFSSPHLQVLLEQCSLFPGDERIGRFENIARRAFEIADRVNPPIDHPVFDLWGILALRLESAGALQAARDVASEGYKRLRQRANTPSWIVAAIGAVYARQLVNCREAIDQNQGRALARQLLRELVTIDRPGEGRLDPALTLARLWCAYAKGHALGMQRSSDGLGKKNSKEDQIDRVLNGYLRSRREYRKAAATSLSEYRELLIDYASAFMQRARICYDGASFKQAIDIISEAEAICDEDAEHVRLSLRLRVLETKLTVLKASGASSGDRINYYVELIRRLRARMREVRDEPGL